MMNRSPFFYVGDKYKLMKQLSGYFPHDVNRLIEPFCGGGSVFLNFHAQRYLANDKNKHMIKLHKFLKSYANNRDSFYKKLERQIKHYGLSASYLGIMVSDELKSKHKKTYYAVFNKKAYKAVKDDFNKNKNDLLLLYILLIYGFNHMLRFNSSGDFNLPVGNVDYNKNVRTALEAYFDFIESNEIDFSCLDFVDFIKGITFKSGDFVYLDPPYLISKCEYNKGWDEKCESALLNLLDELNSKGINFALSNVFNHKGRSNEMLIEWSKKYKVKPVKSNYISYYDNTIKEDTTEVLITNY